MFDRSEHYSRAPAPTGAAATELVTRGEDFASPFEAEVNDRTRRVAIYVDANGNGQLDLLPTYREAYRTFAVQVAVKPREIREGVRISIEWAARMARRSRLAASSRCCSASRSRQRALTTAWPPR